MRPTRNCVKKPLYEQFDDSDIDDGADESLIEGFELDDAIEFDYSEDIDPLEIESLLEEEAGANRAEPELEYTRKIDIEWKRQFFDSKIIPYEPPAEASISGEEHNLKSPLQYFKNYFNDNLFENFAVQTNEYAKQQNRSSFMPTDAAEMKVLFGLHMTMGYIKLPRVSMYWSALVNLEIFKSNMTCDRFFQLRNNLHIVNNLEKPTDGTDKFYKVRPVLNAIRDHLLKLEVEETVSVDEQMIPFKGRLESKQYMKDKLIPWGLKVFVICGKSGMPYDFFIYQGATTELSPTNLKNFGSCASVVLHLANRLDRRGHQLFYDNYFSSYQLLEILRKKHINAGGTIRIDRFAQPPLLADKGMAKKGRGYSDIVVSKNEKVVVVKWQDNKCVHMASNFIGIGTTDTAKRWDKKLKNHVDVTRPEIISLYNGGMGGVDLLDQLISYYRVFIRSKKWPLRVIFHFVDFAICSSWLEYRKDRINAKNPKKDIKDLLNFRIELSQSIIKVGNPTRQIKRGRPRLVTESEEVPIRKVPASYEKRPCKDVRLDKVDHLAEHDSKIQPTRCKKNKCSGRTFFYCSKCKVHLCITKKKNCFAEFHRNN